MYQIGAESVVVLCAVARVDDRVARVGVALGHDQWRARGRGPCGGVSEAERLRRKAGESLIQNDVVPEEADICSQHRMRRKGVRFSESAQVCVGGVANGKPWNIGAEFRIRAAEVRRRVAVARAQGIHVPQ